MESNQDMAKGIEDLLIENAPGQLLGAMKINHLETYSKQPVLHITIP